MTRTVRLRIDTEVEAYPTLDIREIGNPLPGDGFDVPAEMWTALCAAQAAVDDAEDQIMRYVAEHYPNAGSVREWVEGGHTA